MERHLDQGSANVADMRQVWRVDQAGDEHRKTGRKEVESGSKTRLDISATIQAFHSSVAPKAVNSGDTRGRQSIVSVSFF